MIAEQKHYAVARERFNTEASKQHGQDVCLTAAVDAALALVPVVKVTDELANKLASRIHGFAVADGGHAEGEALAALHELLPASFVVQTEAQVEAGKQKTEAEQQRARAEAAEKRAAGLADSVLKNYETAVEFMKERDTARAELAALRDGLASAVATVAQVGAAHSESQATPRDYNNGWREATAYALERFRALLTEAPRAQAPAAGTAIEDVRKAIDAAEAHCQGIEDAALEPVFATVRALLFGGPLPNLKRPAQGQGVARVTTREEAYALVERELREVCVRISLPYAGRVYMAARANGQAHEFSATTLVEAVASAKSLGVTLIDSNAAINEPQAAPVSVPDQIDPDRNKGRVCVRCGADASEPGSRYSHECPKAPVSVPASAPRPEVGTEVPWLDARADMDAHAAARYLHNTDFVYRVRAGVLEYRDELQPNRDWATASDARKGAGRGPATRLPDDAASAPAANAATTGERPEVGEVVPWERAKADMQAHPEARYGDSPHDPRPYRVHGGRLQWWQYDEWCDENTPDKGDQVRLPDATPDAPPASAGLAERVARLEAAVRTLCEEQLIGTDSRRQRALAKLDAGGVQ